VVVRTTGPMVLVSTTGLLPKDAVDDRTCEFDWNYYGALPNGVEIDTSTITVTALKPAGDTSLIASTVSPLGIQAGRRTVLLRLSGGKVGAKYRVANKIVTDESPAQTINRSFLVRIAAG
jgi:hypothetical protein